MVNKIHIKESIHSLRYSLRYFLRLLALPDPKCWLCQELVTDKAPETSNQKQVFFCHACHQDLPHNTYKCFICALPLPLEHHSSHIEQPGSSEHKHFVCGECIQQTPHFSHTLAGFRYEFPIRPIIHQIKYHKQRFWLKPLCQALEQEIRQSIAYQSDDLPSLLIPVPLHKSKHKARSFNQAELIANYFKRAFNLPVNTSILLKTKATSNQSQLNKAQRLRNLKDSLMITTRAKARQRISGKHIALIDDVVTTKATAEHCAELLIEAGALRVDVWCLARTAKDRNEHRNKL